MAAPSFKASSSAGWTYTNSITVSPPASLAEGDLILVVLAGNTGLSSGRPFTPPSGFFEFVEFGDLRFGVAFWKRATASEPASYTFQTNGTSWVHVSLMLFSGTDETMPIGDIATQETPSTTFAACLGPSCDGDQMAIRVVVSEDNRTFTTPATVTEVLDTNQFSGSDVSLYVGYDNSTYSKGDTVPTATITPSSGCIHHTLTVMIYGADQSRMSAAVPVVQSQANYDIFHSASGATSGSGVDLTRDLSPPSGVTSGDLLLLIMMMPVYNIDLTTTIATGFTGLSVQDNPHQFKVYVGYRIATASEPSSYAVQVGAGSFRDITGFMLRITGHDPDDPINNIAFETSYAASGSGSRNFDTPSLVTGQGELVIRGHADNNDDATYNNGSNYPNGSVDLGYVDINATHDSGMRLLADGYSINNDHNPKRHLIFASRARLPFAIGVQPVQPNTPISGPILFSSSGSNSEASGVGPSTAVVGYDAELDGSANVDVSSDGVDLSSISAGDLLFCYTSTGRKYSVIQSIDTTNEIIRTEDLWSVESMVSWAVGGKRQTLAGSSEIWNNSGQGDGKGGWVVEMESGFTETFSSQQDFQPEPGEKVFTIRGAKSSATRPCIYFSNDSKGFHKANNAFIAFEGFDIKNTNASKTASAAISNSASFSSVFVRNMKIADATDKFYIALDGGSRFGFIVSDSDLGHCVYAAARGTASQLYGGSFYNTYIHDCGSYGVFLNSGLAGFRRCVIANNTLDGLRLGRPFDFSSTDSSGYGANDISQSVFYSNGSSGISFSEDLEEGRQITHNIFVSNGSYGIAVGGSKFSLKFSGENVNGNAFYDNTTADYTSGMLTVGDVDLLADPFTASATEDFSLNSDADGGAALRAITSIIGSTTSYPFNWLTDGSGSSGGGGGSTVHPLYAN